MTTPMDLLILGSGPAALALAAQSALRGLAVQLIAPTPEARWTQNFGSWSDELVGTQAEGCIEASWAAPSVFTPRRQEQILDRRYARVHTPRLQAKLRAACTEAGVRV